MTANPFEKFLLPVSVEFPCGRDCSLQPDFLELETLMRGREETQFSKAVKPDWNQVQRRACDLLETSRHLQTIVILCLSTLETRGLKGFSESLEFLLEFVKEYWPHLHPMLDPSDNNDPLERFNILGSLSVPPGTFGDNYRFLERLAELPLAASPRIGRISFADLHFDQWPTADREGAANPAEAAAIFQDTPTETLRETLDSLHVSRVTLANLAAFLSDLPSSGGAPDFELLTQHLNAMKAELLPYLPSDIAADPGASDSSAAPGPRPSTTGDVNGRGDVISTLDKICGYYAKHEPGSPVPLLLQRARRLVDADFLQIVEDLAPDVLNQVRTATGVREAN